MRAKIFLCMLLCLSSGCFKDSTAAAPATAAAGDASACDASTGVCFGKPMPCNGACKSGQQCDIALNACFVQTCKLPAGWDSNAQRITKLSVSAPQYGCDVNGDNKPDNGLSQALVAFQVNAKVSATPIADGADVVVLEPIEPGYKTDGTVFALNLLAATKEATDSGCDATDATANCKYNISRQSYDLHSANATCPVRQSFTTAWVVKQTLNSGGGELILSVTLRILGIDLKLPLRMNWLRGNTSDAQVWKSTFNGQICGVLNKSDWQAAIDGVPQADLTTVGGKDALVALVNKMFKPDIVTPESANAKPDALSVALDFATGPATIVGMTAVK